ncbi:MAG: glycosyltransferase [Turicibacter sp.]|nr:glycosyltransferase [Turicibacter sp.]
MEKEVKVLILTAPFGSGHLQVSGSLVAQFQKNPNTVVEEYDMYSNEYPMITKTMQKAYLKTYAPIGKDIYRMLYYTSSQAIDQTLYAKLFKPLMDFGKENLRQKIRDFSPDLIISVFPVTSLYKLLRKELKIPLYTVITDYYANGLWLYKDARRHFVATNRIAKWGTEKGWDHRQFALTGIPIHPKFYETLDAESLYRKYRISAKRRTLLISAGTHGVLPGVGEMASQLIEDNYLQVIVVCGKNERLYHDLKGIPNPAGRLVVLGYTQDMHELLEISDILITKPGGISLTEAAVKGVPVLLYKPVYGQEMENAKYFSEHSAGIIASNRTELMGAIFSLLDNPAYLEQMKENISKLAQPHSAEKIVNDILQDVTEIALCEICKKHHVRKPSHPLEGALVPDMPASIGKLYEEATAIGHISPTAACALLRLGIQKLFNQVTGSEMPVAKSAELLIRGGQLSQEDKDILTACHVMGNRPIIAGVIDETDTKDIADDLGRFLLEAVQKLITEPKAAKRLTWRFPDVVARR